MLNKIQGKYVWLIYCMLFAYLSYMTVLSLISATANTGNTSIERVVFVTILIFLLLVLYLFDNVKIVLRKRICIIPLILLVYFIPLVLMKSITVLEFTINYISISSWIIAFLFGVCLGIKNQRTEKIGKLVSCFMFIILPASIFIIFQHYIDYNLLQNATVTDTFFIIVLFTPLSLLLNDKKPRIILFSFLFCLGLISLKRSIIIAEVLALAVFYFVSRNRMKKFKESRKIVGSSLFILLSAFAIWFVNSNDFDFIISRFTGIFEDGGSNRDIIYSNMLFMLSNSNILELLVGRGYNSIHSTIGIYSHNDFFTLLIDYGFIGFLLYITFIVTLFRFSLKLLKFRHTGDYGEVAIYTLTLLVLISSSNNLIISPALSSPIMLAFGLIMGSAYKIINNGK